MKIIEEADGGLNTHKKKMKETLDNINEGYDMVISVEETIKDGRVVWRDVLYLHDWGYDNPDYASYTDQDGDVCFDHDKFVDRWSSVF